MNERMHSGRKGNSCIKFDGKANFFYSMLPPSFIFKNKTCLPMEMKKKRAVIKLREDNFLFFLIYHSTQHKFYLYSPRVDITPL